eukprot:jgi/Galph1/3225/GphlegSOOS_G1901.1
MKRLLLQTVIGCSCRKPFNAYDVDYTENRLGFNFGSAFVPKRVGVRCSSIICYNRPKTGVLRLECKKGRKMRQQLFREQMTKQSASPLPEDGTPVFTLFTKSPNVNVWFPVASFQGDGQSKMLVNACKTRWGRRLYMGTLNKGVARSVFGKDFGKLLQRIVRQLPDLREYQSQLQFAYDAAQKGTETNLEKIEITTETGMTGIEWLRYKLFQQVPNDMQVAFKTVQTTNKQQNKV